MSTETITKENYFDMADRYKAFVKSSIKKSDRLLPLKTTISFLIWLVRSVVTIGFIYPSAMFMGLMVLELSHSGLTSFALSWADCMTQLAKQGLTPPARETLLTIYAVFVIMCGVLYTFSSRHWKSPLQHSVEDAMDDWHAQNRHVLHELVGPPTREGKSQFNGQQ